MNKQCSWRKIKGTMVPNLYVMSVGGFDKGLVEKPHDTKTDKNMWRVHVGVGGKARFLCHAPTLTMAKRILENNYGI